MLNRVTVFVVVTAVVMSGGGIAAQKGKPGGGGGNTLRPVSAIFRCPMTTDCIADGIEGDSLGDYRGTLPNGGSTTPEGTAGNNGTYLTEANLLLFALKPGLGRFASFDFSQLVGAAPCAANRACRRTFSRATTDESLPGGRVYPVDAMGADLPNGLLSVPVGAVSSVRLYLNFADPDGRELLWTVRFDPLLHPGSSLASITRLGVDSWVVEALPSHLAGLTSATTSNGRAVKVNEGYFRMPFRIAVSQ